MPKDFDPEVIYFAVRKLFPEMEDTTRLAVEELLEKAKLGVKTDDAIVELIALDNNLHIKFNNLLEVQGKNLDGIMMGGNYTGLGGNPSQPPKARKFICPELGHNFTRHIQKAGEDPGVCPVHNLPLIPLDQKEGEDNE